MEPIFEFNSHITEENYRKGLKCGTNFIPNIISGLLGVFLILEAMWTIIKYIGYIAYGVSDVLMLLAVYGLILCLGVFLLVSAIRAPQKMINNAINEVVMKTGSADVTVHSCFYEQEIMVQSVIKAEQTLHFPYGMITSIMDFREFIVFTGTNRGVYVEKAVIPDNQAFYNFIWSKCPNTKYKKYNK